MTKDYNAIDQNWAEKVLAFWFGELTSKDWFAKSDVLDGTITQRFKEIHAQLLEKAEDMVLTSSREYLAAIIVLDQFPRNMFRGTPKAFATDNKALALAQKAVALKLDVELSTTERQFLYMPYMHSEDRSVQAQSIEVFVSLDDESTINFAVRHKEFIDRFGRYPHRNKILGRKSTPEELAFLAQPGSSF